MDKAFKPGGEARGAVHACVLVHDAFMCLWDGIVRYRHRLDERLPLVPFATLDELVGRVEGSGRRGGDLVATDCLRELGAASAEPGAGRGERSLLDRGRGRRGSLAQGAVRGF